MDRGGHVHPPLPEGVPEIDADLFSKLNNNHHNNHLKMVVVKGRIVKA